MLTLDGSYGEGGGSLTRIALAMSVLTNTPVRITNIRSKRSNPGLKPQHLHAIKALKELTNADVEGNTLASEELFFTPNRFKTKNLEIDIGTAGSISLLLQSLIPPLMFATRTTKLTIKGGTQGKWQMPVEYLKNVYFPYIKKFSTTLDIKLIKRGYYPKGGGLIELKIKPKYKLKDYPFLEDLILKLKEDKLQFDQTNQSHLIRINGVSHSSIKLDTVADRQSTTARMNLTKYDVPINIRSEYPNTLSLGSGITLWATFSRDKDELSDKNPIIVGSDNIGEKGIKAEDVAIKAVKSLDKEINSKASIDEHLADNLILWLALAGGEITTSNITNHTKTNIWVIEQFLGKIFKIENNKISV